MTLPIKQSAEPSTAPSQDWTRGAPKIAAAIAILLFATGALTFTLSRGDHTNASTTAASLNDTPQRINLNTASRAELVSLPAIGPKRAAAIIDDRDRRGPFTTIDDLDRVQGIGPRTVDRLRPFVTVDPPRHAAGQ